MNALYVVNVILGAFGVWFLVTQPDARHDPYLWARTVLSFGVGIYGLVR